MSALSDALATFVLSDGQEQAQTDLFLAGAEHESAHLLKHLDAAAADAVGPLKTALADWRDRIVNDPTARITRVLAD